MGSARGLDLTGAGDPPFHARERGGVLDTAVVEASQDLSVEPLRVVGALHWPQLAGQGVGTDTASLTTGQDPKVGQAGTEPLDVDGVSDLPIEALGNKHGAGEPGGHRLDRDTPGLLPLHDGEDLADERKDRSRLTGGARDDLAGVEQVRGHGRAGAGDALSLGAQRLQLVGELELVPHHSVRLHLERLQLDPKLTSLPIQLIGELGEGGGRLRRLGSQDAKVPGQVAQLVLHSRQVLAGGLEASLYHREFTACHPGPGGGEVLDLGPGSVLGTLSVVNLPVQDGDGGTGPVPSLFKPVPAQPADVGIDALGEFLAKFLILLRPADGKAQRQQRSQDLLLPAGINDGRMRVTQLGELLHRIISQGEGAGGIEHEVTQERVQAGQALGGLSAVEEALGHLTGQSQTSSEGCREGTVALEEASPISQMLTQPPFVYPCSDHAYELDEVLLALDEDLDLTGRVRSAAHVVKLEQCQSICGVQAGEGQGDAAASGTGPQVVGDNLAGGLLRDPPVGAMHIGQDGAGTVIGAGVLGGGVEAQVLGGHQDGGQGVQEGGLAGARGTGQQQARAGDGQVVIATEGAPVIDLDPGESVLPRCGALDSACAHALRRTHRAHHFTLFSADAAASSLPSSPLLS